MALYGIKPILKGLLGSNAEDMALFVGRVTFGASTAVASQIGNDMVVTKVDTGIIKVQFSSGWGTLLGAFFSFKDASGAVLTATVVDESNLATDGYLLVETRNTTSEVAPTSGDTLFMAFALSDSQNNKVR
jgi:hypothetical protein